MSVKKFKFISPGVSVEEIDKSNLADQSERRGPILFGRAEHGPSMRPVAVHSFSEFVETFGEPIPGGRGGDVWRDGNYTSTTYASYAAQAYLKNNSPVTFVRLLGSLHGDVTAGTGAETPGWKVDAHSSATGGGTYGLFLFDSASYGSRQPGTLAAVWYTNNASTVITLSGAYAHGDGSQSTSSIGALVRSVGDSREFKAEIRQGATVSETVNFNFSPTSDKFVRKVFNTNPTLVNTATIATAQRKNYWLGETFEGSADSVGTGAGGVLDSTKSTTGNTHGAMLILSNNATTVTRAGLLKKDASESKSGWVVAQDLGTATGFTAEDAQKLFRFCTRNSGEWDSKNLKISVQNIKFSNNEYEPYGSFSVLIRSANDTDSNIKVHERFENLSLNPNSDRYISRVIGDRYPQWNETERRLREYGTYDNVSKFVRVEVSVEVEAGGDARWLPAGFFGPPRFKKFTATSASLPQTFGSVATGNDDSTAMALNASGSSLFARVTGSFLPSAAQFRLITSAPATEDKFIGDITFPSYKLRNSSADTTLRGSTAAYFGIETRRDANGRLHDSTAIDLSRPKPQNADNHVATTGLTETSFIFTMDDLSASSDFTYATDTKVDLTYISGSRKLGTSLTAAGLTGTKLTVASNFEAMLDQGYNQFTLPLVGGFDGLDVTEREPLRNSLITGTDKTSFVHNTYKRAIDFIQDVENVDINLAAVPGLTNETLTGRLIDNCEERGDALAVIDISSDYTPIYEGSSDLTEASRLGSVDSAVSAMKARNINSSYGAAYYPWVLVKDTATSGQIIWMPPSAVALGVIGNSANKSELWFAPAGFNRGGLTEGHSGLSVVGVRQKLSAKERDKLYEQHINPIASFPSEGVVVFGQKTLQLTQSALDRINVRRLMIFLKKEISFAASRILFDQNVRSTWNRFTGQVEPLLADVQSRFGLTDFKLVLDETTTTDEMVDRNIMYAKVFVKPARAIEYIALDFIVTSTGASFEE